MDDKNQDTFDMYYDSWELGPLPYQLNESIKETILKAFQIPFWDLPLYVNDKNEVIRLIAQERLNHK